MSKRFVRLGAKLVLSAILSLTVAAITGWLLRYAGEGMIERAVDTPAFEARAVRQVLDKIQYYIDENDLTVTQVKRLDELFTRTEPYMLILYSGDMILYDTTGLWAGERVGEALDASELGCSLRFADDTVGVVLIGDYTSRYYAMLDAGVVAFSVLLFILLYTGLIRRRLCYIVRLEKEMRVLEGGDLRHEVPVKGRDELSALAKSINDMRLATLERQEGEVRAMKAGRELIAALSHDLRTPLTALIGYLELLASGHYGDEAQFKHFIESGRAKAYRIKEMTDELFQYAVDAIKDEGVFHGEVTEAGPLFRQLIDEYQLDLEHEGFAVKCPQEDINAQVEIVPDEIARVFDNIVSNIRKYASKDEPVIIDWKKSNGKLIVSFQNGIPAEGRAEAGTGLGLASCRRILDWHEGSFDARKDEGHFCVHIRLPVYKALR